MFEQPFYEHTPIMRARASRPHVQFLDRGTEHWRVAVVAAIESDQVTLRILFAVGLIRDYPVPRGSVPVATLGAPVAVQVSHDAPDAFVVLQVCGTHYGPDGPGTNEARALERGLFPVLGRHITKESEWL